MTYLQTDITNSISSLGKPSKNEIPNNYKKVFEGVWKNLKIINNLMLEQSWHYEFADKVIHRGAPLLKKTIYLSVK